MQNHKDQKYKRNQWHHFGYSRCCYPNPPCQIKLPSCQKYNISWSKSKSVCFNEQWAIVLFSIHFTEMLLSRQSFGCSCHSSNTLVLPCFFVHSLTLKVICFSWDRGLCGNTFRNQELNASSRFTASLKRRFQTMVSNQCDGLKRCTMTPWCIS